MTNYDGLVVSALVEAQSETTAKRKAGPCPLRGMRSSPIVQGSAARLAAAVSLVLASAKISDHVTDRDGLFGRRGVSTVAQRIAGRWAKQGASTGSSLGFDTAVLLDAVAAQPSVEASLGTGGSLLTATEPTEVATAAAFAHTAVLSGRPDNAEPLAEAGRLFGRIAHLVDAVEDLDKDRESGAWNPLITTGTSLEETRRLCDDAMLGVRLALREAEFVDDKLIHKLLAHELDHAIQRAFGDPHNHTPSNNTREDEREARRTQRYSERKTPRRGLAACGLATFMFCTCQYCCADPYYDPWTGEPKKGWCRRLDCSCCDCPRCDCRNCSCDCCCCDCSC